MHWYSFRLAGKYEFSPSKSVKKSVSKPLIYPPGRHYCSAAVLQYCPPPPLRCNEWQYLQWTNLPGWLQPPDNSLSCAATHCTANTGDNCWLHCSTANTN